MVSVWHFSHPPFLFFYCSEVASRYLLDLGMVDQCPIFVNVKNYKDVWNYISAEQNRGSGHDHELSQIFLLTYPIPGRKLIHIEITVIDMNKIKNV